MLVQWPLKEEGVEAHTGRGVCGSSREESARGVPPRGLGHACAEREGESAADSTCALAFTIAVHCASRCMYVSAMVSAGSVSPPRSSALICTIWSKIGGSDAQNRIFFPRGSAPHPARAPALDPERGSRACGPQIGTPHPEVRDRRGRGECGDIPRNVNCDSFDSNSDNAVF